MNPPETRASSQDVAERAGVSRATVSAYINKTRFVSDELGGRIEQAIRDLRYVPDPFARALKVKDSKTIGLIIPVLSRFFTPMMRAINEVAHRNRYGFLLCSSEEDADREREVLEMMTAKRLSGILLVPCSLKNQKLIKSIQKTGTPIVLVNRRIEGLDADVVVSDNCKAAYMATDHLIEKGRRRIALFGHDPDSLALLEKKNGYDKALRDHGIGESIVIRIRQNDPEQMRQAFLDFIDAKRPHDGLICTSQAKTSVALQVLKERNIRIPEEVAVVGFDDTPWASLLWRPLTVISESTYQMGESAVRLLLDRLEKRETGPPRTILLEDEFIIREST